MRIFKKNTSHRPNDLPDRYSWAKDEIVRLRLENDDLLKEITRLKYTKLSPAALAHLLRKARTMPYLDEESQVTECNIGPHGSISLSILDCEGDSMEFIFDPEERHWVVTS